MKHIYLILTVLVVGCQTTPETNIQYCNIKLPEGTQIEYSKEQGRYIVSIQRWNGKKYLDAQRSSVTGYNEWFRLYESSLFNDSCEAKRVWQEYADQVYKSSGKGFKPI